ncbi:MAG: tRNA(His) guanylyltransferase Thg1 family protein [bacterium]
MNLEKEMLMYEQTPRTSLVRRVPVIIRIDGKAFHTYTKDMKKPWDKDLYKVFGETTKYLCENIQGAKLGYFQSDEISILLIDYDNEKTEAWFKYRTEKLLSVSASHATAKFNIEMAKLKGLNNIKLAEFDSKAFNIPKEKVCDYFIYRQNDATRNSIQGLGQEHFRHKELEGVSNKQVQDKLMLELGINWNNCEVWQKRGACVIKKQYVIKAQDNPYSDEDVIRNRWVVDDCIPIFSKNTNYINDLVYINND